LIVFFLHCQRFLRNSIESISQNTQTFSRLSIGFCFVVYIIPHNCLFWFITFNNQQGEGVFFQQRPGLNSKPFKIIKFKTMRDAFDDNGAPLRDEVRLQKLVDLYVQHH
jgi:lipopolysaccharide/colanic/teichoic acid biosynthesis glycosyltransferase